MSVRKIQLVVLSGGALSEWDMDDLSEFPILCNCKPGERMNNSLSAKAVQSLDIKQENY